MCRHDLDVAESPGGICGKFQPARHTWDLKGWARPVAEFGCGKDWQLGCFLLWGHGRVLATREGVLRASVLGSWCKPSSISKKRRIKAGFGFQEQRETTDHHSRCMVFLATHWVECPSCLLERGRDIANPQGQKKGILTYMHTGCGAEPMG